MVDAVGHPGCCAHQGKRMDRIRAVVKHAVNSQNHPLVNVQTLPGDLLHHCRVLTCIHYPQFSNRLADAYHAAIRVTERAFLIVDQQDLAVAHHAVATSGANSPNSLDPRNLTSMRMLEKCMTPSRT